ncbi:hypothetical protein Kisp02_29870 [Kineosporia sp. NBRC 101731]|nr:hypothetical protein Kisp02_29870 [Kineosporia sp. NBRC 101731]
MAKTADGVDRTVDRRLLLSQRSLAHGEDDLTALRTATGLMHLQEISTPLSRGIGQLKVVGVLPAQGLVAERDADEQDQPEQDDRPGVAGAETSQPVEATGPRTQKICHD